MNNITTIGLDLAKRVFQVHGMDHEGRAVLRKKFRRGQVLKFFAILPPCLVGMEACGSAHHWARELSAQGHQVRLIPPQYVRPFLKTNKHDAPRMPKLSPRPWCGPPCGLPQSKAPTNKRC
jgi:transposase